MNIVWKTCGFLYQLTFVSENYFRELFLNWLHFFSACTFFRLPEHLLNQQRFFESMKLCSNSWRFLFLSTFLNRRTFVQNHEQFWICELYFWNHENCFSILRTFWIQKQFFKIMNIVWITNCYVKFRTILKPEKFNRRK